MSRVITDEVDGIETVEQLFVALAKYPVGTRVGDSFGEPLILRLIFDSDTQEEEIEIG